MNTNNAPSQSVNLENDIPVSPDGGQEQRAKRPYNTPQLTKHGSMVELTGGGGGSSVTGNPVLAAVIVGF